MPGATGIRVDAGVRGRRRGRHALRRDAGQGDRAGRRPGPRPLRRLAARPASAPRSTASRTNRDLLVGCCGTRRSWPGELSHRLPRAARPRRAGRAAGRRGRRRRLGVRRGRSARRRAGRARRAARDPGRLAQRGLAAAARPCSDATTRSGRLARAPATATRAATSAPSCQTVRSSWPTSASDSSGCAARSGCYVDGDARRRRVRRSGTSSLTRTPRFVDPADQVAERFAARADARVRRTPCTSRPAPSVAAGEPSWSSRR